MIERTVTIKASGQEITGLLWLPDEPQRAMPLVVAGHGFTLHKRALFPPTLVQDLNGRRFAVAAIDAPAHGDHAADPHDRAAINAAWREHWREFGAALAVAEHSALLDALCAMPEIDGTRIGYFGLSLGTQYGLGVLGKEPRFRAAVLGLSALPVPGPRMTAYAPRVTCPIFFIQQLDDEIAAADRARALFDLIGSRDKTLRASPGAHTAVPRAVFEEAYDFLKRHLALTPDA
jgi:dienelactone hydrolase